MGEGASVIGKWPRRAQTVAWPSVRMQLMLTADGKDITEAMAKLKTAQGVAGKKLAELERG